MYLISIAAFAGNDLWVLHNGKRALAVDPSGAEPVFSALEQSGSRLDSILVTHHHAKHSSRFHALRTSRGTSVHGPVTARISPPLRISTESNKVGTPHPDFQLIDVPGCLTARWRKW